MISMTYINLADIVFNESKFERPSSSQIKALADSILEVGGLIHPLIVEQIDGVHTTFRLIDNPDNYWKYLAVEKAFEMNRRHDLINCFVISPKSGKVGYEHAYPKGLIERQMRLLTAELHSNNSRTRLDAMQLEIDRLQAGLNNLRSSL
jgi:hypothetical protein